MDPHGGPTREQLQYTFNLLQRFRDNILILDTRSREEFEKLHLAGALPLSQLADTERPLTLQHIESVLPDKAAVQLFARRKRLCTLICHSECSRSLATEVYQWLQADKCKELHVLAAPIGQFLSIYNFLSSSYIIPAPIKTVRVGFPNEIIPSRLFLGTQMHAQSKEIIEALGITHIVNATKTVHNKFPDSVQYCRILVEDSDTEMICYHFNIAFRFLDHALSTAEDQQNRVLVHCAMGVSRSATIVIMYLMKKFDWTFEEAYDFARRHRYEVQPNDGFQEQLREFCAARRRFKHAQQMRRRRMSEIPSIEPDSPTRSDSL